MTPATRRVTVGALARVEGEGALRLVIEGDVVERAELAIYEPPRFFEAFLRGRQHTEVSDITSRICGICPVAYQTSAWRAVEDACDVRPGPDIEALRRLLYCGEWISSHALHIFLLHVPDFLGYPDAISLAGDRRDLVELGLRLKKAGNAVLDVVGGRSIHPVNPRVGGFHRAPTVAELDALAEQLRPALEDALATVSFVASLSFPDFDLDHDLLAVDHPDRYAIDDGTIHSSRGHSFPVQEFLDHVTEEHVAHSTALHATLDGRRYLTGPLARYTLNYEKLSPLAQRTAVEAGLSPVCRNPYRSIVVRGVEIVYAVEEALRIIDSYRRPEPSWVEVPGRAGVGHGVSEAPRGLLYHRYELDSDGSITAATIVPPTSQNQAAIEHDMLRVATESLHLDDTALALACERAIRNYDPCISCSTHFLDLTVDRR